MLSISKFWGKAEANQTVQVIERAKIRRRCRKGEGEGLPHWEQP
jgi:hypothetical protein